VAAVVVIGEVAPVVVVTEGRVVAAAVAAKVVKSVRSGDRIQRPLKRQIFTR